MRLGAAACLGAVMVDWFVEELNSSATGAVAITPSAVKAFYPNVSAQVVRGVLTFARHIAEHRHVAAPDGRPSSGPSRRI
jgi:hypothetical protein